MLYIEKNLQEKISQIQQRDHNSGNFPHKHFVLAKPQSSLSMVVPMSTIAAVKEVVKKPS